MKQLILFGLIVILSSCSERYNDFTVITDGDENNYEIAEISLTGENLITENLFGSIKDIHFNNNKLFVLDGSSSNVISKLDLKTNVLTPLVMKGEGPNEINNGSTVKINKVQDGVVEFHEYYNSFINYVDEQNPQKIIEGSQLPEEHIGAQSATSLANDKIGVVGTKMSSTFLIIGDNKSETIELPNHLDFGRGLSNEEKNIVMPKNIGYSNKQLFFWRNQFNTIEVLSENGELKRIYSFGKNENISKEGLHRKFTYYFNAKADKEYVYAMYAGFNTLENFTEDLIPTLRTELHIFNTNTDEILRYKFDRLINYCTIDFDNKVIYAVEENNENHPIVIYDFNVNI